MKAGVFRGAYRVAVEEVREPVIQEPTDAVVRIVRSSVCGSDLWFYRGVRTWQPGWRTGHELTGIVEAVGEEVASLRPGDLVVAAFAYSDGTCEFCRAGLHTSCVRGGFFGGGEVNGGQAERARVPFADGTCWVVPPETPEERWDSLHMLTDVLLTGYHAAVMAGAGTTGRNGEPVDTVVVVGDGAVGLSGVVSARMLGASTVLLCGHHTKRLELGRRLGATDALNLRGQALVDAVRDRTDGGAPAVLECVGTSGALADAVAVCRDGGRIGMVGVPAAVDAVPVSELFARNLTLSVGVAPTRAYVEEVGPRVATGEVDVSPIASDRFALDELSGAYAAMDERTTIKALVIP